MEFLPTVTYFKPVGVPLAHLEEIQLTVDEVEALRLKDLEGLDQTESAERMNLAQSTFQRILTAARAKLSRALIEGRALRIEGGNYRLVQRECAGCGHAWPNPSRPLAEACPACGSPMP